MKLYIKIVLFIIIILSVFSGCHKAEEVTVIVELNNGKGSNTYSLTDNDTVSDIPSPERYGYTFSGWYSDKELTMPVNNEDKASSAKLYAKWEINNYSVNFDLRFSDSIAPLPQQIEYLKFVSEPEVSREGHTLTGWYTNSGLTNLYDFSLPVTDNINLYAKWMINYYEVTFDINGTGISPAKQSILYQGLAAEPENPSRTGWNFVGWCLDYNTLFDFNSPITHNIMLYAKWEQAIYTITFNSTGGTGITGQNKNYPELVTEPSDPTRTGYDFDGWYIDIEYSAIYDFSNIVTSDITLYAKWITDFIFTETDTTITISGLREGLIIYDLEIPSTYTGKTVTAIAENAFSNNQDIITVSIPSTVKNIGEGAFYNCKNITGFTVVPNNSYLSVNGVLYEYTFKILNTFTTKLIRYPLGNEALEFNIPNTTVSLGISAFEGAVNLTAINFPSSVASIGDYAFKDCSNLVGCSFPTTTVDLGIGLFMNCISLESAGLSSALPGIPESMFNNCSSLVSFTFPNLTLTIGNSAFRGCSMLNSVTMNNYLQFIDSYAFENCTNLTAISLPDSLSLLGISIFNNCNSLETVSIGNSLNTLGISMFSNCSNLAEILIPLTVTSLSEMTFYNCSSLNNIVLPDSMINIPVSAFMGCSGMTNIDLGNSITRIETTAFSGCSGLTLIIIPSTITYIGSLAFNNCSNLTSIIILSASAPEISFYPFTLKPVIYYPIGATGYDGIAWYFYDKVEGIPV